MVGGINTVVSAFIMLILYNIVKIGYWGASAVAYILGSCLSFYLNKNFTFKNNGSNLNTATKFFVGVIICYVIAYMIAKPFVIYIFSICELHIGIEYVEQIAMLIGMCIFTLLNYISQRYFIFKG